MGVRVQLPSGPFNPNGELSNGNTSENDRRISKAKARGNSIRMHNTSTGIISQNFRESSASRQTGRSIFYLRENNKKEEQGKIIKFYIGIRYGHVFG